MNSFLAAQFMGYTVNMKMSLQTPEMDCFNTNLQGGQTSRFRRSLHSSMVVSLHGLRVSLYSSRMSPSRFRVNIKAPGRASVAAG